MLPCGTLILLNDSFRTRPGFLHWPVPLLAPMQTNMTGHVATTLSSTPHLRPERMPRDDDTVHEGMSGSPGLLFRAAEYVRMSTEHQQYSTDNQRDKIREYAAKRGIEIIRTYADEGKSGLRIEGRQALQKLIKDVESGVADFQVILVYDVSRWGRFQDADESAYYEYICRRAGKARRPEWRASAPSWSSSGPPHKVVLLQLISGAKWLRIAYPCHQNATD